MGKQAIVFDLDGTLVDSLPDLHAALSSVLTGEGVAPPTMAETRGFIGHGIPQLVAQARIVRGLPSAREEAMVQAMFATYLAAPAALTRPYDGVIAALAALRADRFVLGLCTNKALAPTRRILHDLGMAALFDLVIGGDSLPVKKPDPAPLQAAFAPLGQALLYVGDSEVDAEAAARAGIPFALFTKGYRKAEVAALPHRFAFDDWHDFRPRLMALGQQPA